MYSSSSTLFFLVPSSTHSTVQGDDKMRCISILHRTHSINTVDILQRTHYSGGVCLQRTHSIDTEHIPTFSYLIVDKIRSITLLHRTHSSQLTKLTFTKLNQEKIRPITLLRRTHSSQLTKVTFTKLNQDKIRSVALLHRTRSIDGEI